MSKIYLWKLGKTDGPVSNWIMPSKAAIDRFKKLLTYHLRRRIDTHLVWDDAVSVQVVDANLDSEVHVIDSVDKFEKFMEKI